MRFVSINGSPRGEKGSTHMLLDAFEKGLARTEGVAIERINLRRKSDFARATEAFAAADSVLIAYPLYTDIMPSLTLAFIETLAPKIGSFDGKRLGFLVQSGFPEACQSRPAERYNEKLARRLGCTYAGCAIRGNCNRLEVQPKFMVRAILKQVEAVGASMAAHGTMDPTFLKKLAAPERMGRFSLFFFGLLSHMPLAHLHWNKELKQNGAFASRDATPYWN